MPPCPYFLVLVTLVCAFSCCCHFRADKSRQDRDANRISSAMFPPGEETWFILVLVPIVGILNDQWAARIDSAGCSD